jgi:hypothetical protein
MSLVLENIKNSNQITQNEFEQWAGVIYGSISISDKDSQQMAQQKEQTLDALIAYISNYLFTNNWASDEAELACIDFLSKLQLQKEVLQILNGTTKIEDVQASIRTFSAKNQYPVGMR